MTMPLWVLLASLLLVVGRGARAESVQRGCGVERVRICGAHCEAVRSLPCVFATWSDMRAALGRKPLRHTVIEFGPGLHFLNSSSLVLGLDDANVSLVGAGREATVVSGGVLLDEWVDAPEWPGYWQARLPDNVSYVRQLFVYNQTRAATPGLAFSRRFTARSAEMVYNHTNMNDPEHSIVLFPGQFNASYHNPGDVLVSIYHCWTLTTHRVRAFDPTNLTLTLLQAPHVDIPRCEHASGKRFYVEDAREYLARVPGRFYVDREARMILYHPLPLEASQRSKFQAVIGQNITLLRGAGASGVRIANLSLMHGQVDMLGYFEGDCDAQSATNLKSAAVVVNNGSDWNITNVAIAHVGTHGLWLNASVSNVLVQGLHTFDTAASGVRLGHYSAHPATRATQGVILEDSLLETGGQVYVMAPGMLLVACRACRVAYNTIRNFSYSGISTGYGFSEAPADLADTVLYRNHLHSLGQGVLSDMGCVYTWGGDQAGLRVDGNVCHDVVNFDPALGGYGGWGIYTDQSSRNVVICNNLVYDTASSCVHEHEATAVLLSNNILVQTGRWANPGAAALRGALPDPRRDIWANFTLTTNVLVSEAGNASSSGLLFYAAADWAVAYNSSAYDSNLYFVSEASGRNASALRVFPGGVTLATWQAQGYDRRSREADPLFADPAARNFSLLPNSPALALGFQPVPWELAGCSWPSC
ncbi:uncharacterized protein MONBRDRAFT_7138 [Monosiga brevicollis MX1]|uniref:Right handed beta helix domain-containing protein n=1 Tax=Monosiga brevicollis TaxID=81824 RepID=A9UW18_MONBE|nr:uncharacterized protein MONBRDRAFT_7138 [Monosiga brevicollis MX1]EDQ90484.1 predicted protein [Monosiga brevicollis MX1]|eukprot:XP_001744535.1 hypothetical protein [Monosiga brevicollis MX1]